MLLSSSLDLVKYINPNLFYYYFAKTRCTVLQLSSQKRPAYKCKFCFTRHEREEHQGRGLELHFFSAESFQFTRNVLQKVRKIEMPRKQQHCLRLKVTNSFTTISGWKNLCPGSENMDPSIGRRGKPHVRERKKHVALFAMGFP